MLNDPLVRANVIGRIAQLRPDAKPLWGRMTANQMLCHLNDSFLACMGKRAVSQATSPVQRTVVKWIALYAPLRWPKGVPTRPEVEQGVGGTPPTNFDCDRTNLLGLIKRVSGDARDFEWSSHPIFGAMTERQS